jgi:N-carbamoyl-L-amino-acid hydrolase
MKSKKAADIAQSSGTIITFKINYSALRLRINPFRRKLYAQSLNLTYKQMQSGAGHDSQDMALIAPIGMIFVPSVAGISHSPKEFSKAVDMANGRTY